MIPGVGVVIAVLAGVGDAGMAWKVFSANTVAWRPGLAHGISRPNAANWQAFRAGGRSGRTSPRFGSWSSRPARDETLEEDTMAAHLAVTLIQWSPSGAMRRCAAV